MPSAPSWSSALKKGGVASVLFVVLLTIFGQNPAASLLIGLLLLGFYAPLAYMMDGFFYRRYLRKEAEKRVEKEKQRAGQRQAPG